MLKRNQSKDVYELQEIRSAAKETPQFFKFLEANLIKENIHLLEISKRQIKFTKKISGKTLFIEIQDTENQNFFELEIFSQKLTLESFLPQWMKKNFLGVKIGNWFILLLVSAMIIPLIVYIAFGENIPTSLDKSLLIVGIILMCSGVIGLGVYLLQNRILRNQNERRIVEAKRISLEIQRLVREYSETGSNMQICWKCFEEIKKGIKNCPKCGIEI